MPFNPNEPYISSLYGGANVGSRYRWTCTKCGEVHDSEDFRCECEDDDETE